MKLKLIILVNLVITLNVFSFSQTKTDRENANLRNNVKSIKETCYKLEEKFGELSVGHKTREGLEQGRDNLNQDYLKKFNKNGSLNESYIFYQNDNVYIKITYQYVNNVIQKTTTYAYNEDDGNLSFTIESLYNKGKEKEDNSYDPNKKLISKTKYEYDKNGFLNVENDYLEDGSLYSKIVYKNNSIGKCETEINYDENGYKTETNSYRYNSKGLVVEEINDGKDAFGLPQKTIYNYTYDKKDNLILFKITTLGGTWSNSYKYTYNMKGDVIKIQILGGKNQLLDTWTYKYKYDTKGNWVELQEFENLFPKYILKREIEYY